MIFMGGKEKKLILFDLDGVLVNSRENMRIAWADVQENLQVTTPFEDYFQLIGRPFQEIIRRLELSDQGLEIEERFVSASMAIMKEIQFYDGVPEGLLKLSDAGFLLGVITSKDSVRTKIILERLPVSFISVQTPNERYRGKPAPDHFLVAMLETQIDPEQILYIGDMDVDCIAAKRAGVSYCHANWGYGTNPDEQIPGFNDINELIRFIFKEFSSRE